MKRIFNSTEASHIENDILFGMQIQAGNFKIMIEIRD